MSEEIPVYVMGPSGGPLDALPERGVHTSPLDATSFREAWTSLPPGLVLVDPSSVPPAQILEVLRPVSAAHHGWMIGLVGRGADGPTVRVLSLSPEASLDEALGAARDPAASPGTLLELQGVLAQVARVRHDLNNPLTSALAEVQLALMDTEGPEHTEIRESLETIQAQLRRIRDLIASSGHLRPKKP